MTQPLPPLESPEVETSDPFEGTPYRMIRRLARGGMGQVYVVEHRELGRECVAKLIREKLASEPQLLERVRIEAESLGALNHPNIVSVNNFGTTQDGRPFIVMEYLQGKDLGRTLASGRTFTPAEAIDLVLQASRALAAAHGIGIIHRDIKPDNLFLHEELDGTVILKVLDFGVARVIPGVSPDTPTPLPQPTATGVIVGTLRYGSPEAVSGHRVDYRTDIYSLGLVLYRLLARRGPFDDGRGEAGLITACLLEEPKPPSFLAPVRISPELDAVVLKALRKSPDERYPSMREFGEALAQVQILVDTQVDDGQAAPIPLTARADAESLPGTVPAARNIARKRAQLVNVMLFAVVLLITALVVGILVSHMGHTMVAP
jgi:eukaryotic-like serine/threonine-protein kinase